MKYSGIIDGARQEKGFAGIEIFEIRSDFLAEERISHQTFEIGRDFSGKGKNTRFSEWKEIFRQAKEEKTF